MGDGDAEFGAFGGDAEVGAGCELESAADTKAAYHADGGFADGSDGVERAVEFFGVEFGAGRIVTGGLEFADVGTGRECAFARAAKDDDADGFVLVERVHESGELGPHLGVDGVALVGTVEGDGGDVILVGEED